MIKIEFNRIRELITLYYQAETTPEQERELYDFFINHSICELPDDLRAESELFVMMESLGKKAPEDLLQEIDRAIDSEKVKKIALSRRVISYWISAAAVLIAAVLCFSLLFKNETAEKERSQSFLAVNEDEVIPNDSLPDSVEIVSEVSIEEVEEKAPVPLTKKPKIIISQSNLQAYEPKVNNDNPGNYVIIDDGQEAVNILLAVNARFDKAFAKSASIEKHIPEFDKIIDNVSNKLKNMLL